MPTHDPSTCPRCRWAAEREGWTSKVIHESYMPPEGGVSQTLEYIIWKYPNGITAWDGLPSYCPSVDAVAGLMKEMQGHGVWSHRWDRLARMWAYSTGILGLGSPCFYSKETLPGGCVIAAAMQVFKEESDD